MEPNDALR